MHTIDRKRWFCIPPGTPRGATGDGAASARAPSAPPVPRKRTGSRRRPHAPHGFPPRRQRARTLRRPARARRRETFSVAGSELAIRPRTRPARINASVTLYRTDAKAPHASGAYPGRPFHGRQHTGGRPGKQRTLPFPARRARPGGGRPCGRKSRFPRRRDGKPTPDARNRYLLPFCGFGDILPPNLEPNRVRGLPILF